MKSVNVDLTLIARWRISDQITLLGMTQHNSVIPAWPFADLIVTNCSKTVEAEQAVDGVASVEANPAGFVRRLKR